MDSSPSKLDDWKAGFREGYLQAVCDIDDIVLQVYRKILEEAHPQLIERWVKHHARELEEDEEEEEEVVVCPEPEEEPEEEKPWSPF